MIDIKDMSFKRGNREIFKNLNLRVKRNTITAILGPSGTGKTTLLRLIGGLLKPKTGSIEVLSKQVRKLSSKELFNLRKRMGMLFQSGGLFTDLSVFENVAFGLNAHTRLPQSAIYDMVLMKLQAVGLRGAHSLRPSELSGGMSRRVALARALALDPELMLYDEPFTGQDPISMGVVVKLIKTLNDALGLTSVVVTHDVEEIFSIADYAYIVSGGEVIGEGTPDELQANDDPKVRQFVHGDPDGPVPFHYPANEMEVDYRLPQQDTGAP